MPQTPKIVDLTKSYVFTDPATFPDNRGFTQQQDAPTETLPLVAMEGYNFLPTSYGYRSYFGDSSILDIAPLPARCDKVILFQLANFQNVLIALCEDGIWYSEPASIPGAAWVHAATYTIPAVGVHYEWSYCLLENVLYCYQQGRQEVWSLKYTSFTEAPTFTLSFERQVPCTIRNYNLLAEMNADTTLTGAEVGKLAYCYEDSTYYYLETTTPTWATYSSTTHGNFILNMQGQLGIFRANLRLGFWDSANSIGWSDSFDKMDFEPSVTTRAGNSIFSGILGRIVAVLPQGSGFVIYSTKNIVGIRFVNEIASIWDAMVISDTAGIAYPYQATTGATESDHYAFTNTGIVAIGKYNPISGRNDYQTILPEVYDILKESGEPVYLDFLQGRYLFISLISPTYITGALHFAFDSTRDLVIQVLHNTSRDNGISIQDITIGAQSLSAALLDQLSSGNEEGIFLWWTASGVAMVPDRISPINPYSLDTLYNRIPNTPPPYDISSLLSASEVQGLVSGGIYVHPTPTRVDLNMGGKLAIAHYSPRAAGEALLGYSDVGLSSAMAAQEEEWANYQAILGNTLNAINAATPIIEPAVQGTYAYDNQTLATNAMELFIEAELASHSGAYRVGNSVFWEEPVGELPSGDSTPNSLEFPDIGRHFAFAFLRKDFHGGYPIKRTVEKAFSLRQGAVNGYKATAVGPSYLSAFSGTANDQLFAEALGLPYTLPETHYEYGQTPEQAIANFGVWIGEFFASIPDPPPSYNQVVSGLSAVVSPNLTNTRWDISIAPSSMSTASWNTTDGASYSGHVQFASSGYSVDYGRVSFGQVLSTTSYRYYVDSQTTKTLTLAPYDPNLTSYEAYLEGQQTDLTWSIRTGPDTYSYTDASIILRGVDIAASLSLPPYAEVTYPGATFLLQDGSPAPIYPEFSGALVLDTHLKKLGKYYGNHTSLVELAPINNNLPSLPYTNFGLTAGVLKADSTIRAFSSQPTASYIKYGLYGLYRQGYTVMQECRVTQRRPMDYSVEIKSSLDGKNEEMFYSTFGSYSGDTVAVLPVAQSGRWHTITISGNYDLTGLEIRSTISGRR